MPERAHVNTPVAPPSCSEESEGASCCIEDCACAEAEPIPVSLRLPLRSPSGPDASSETGTESSLTLRSGLLFVVACLTSPCCTPLFVPIGIALLAGTPLAVWLTPHVGWVYAALTIVSVLSLLIAFLSLARKSGWSPRLIKSVNDA